MRLQIDPRLIFWMRHPAHSKLRFHIFTLYNEQDPDWAIPVEGLPEHYLFHVDGLTILYQVYHRRDMESFVKIALIDLDGEADTGSTESSD